MAKITADLVKQTLAPIHQIMEMYDEKADFVQDLESYLQAGVVISTPAFLPDGQACGQIHRSKRSMVYRC